MDKDFFSNTALPFWNGVDFAILVMLLWMLLLYLKRETKNWKDVRGRLAKITSINFQGGPYDLVVALSVVLLGRVIRAETAWDFRAFDMPLRAWQLALGSAVTAWGGICLIRVMSRAKNFNLTWILCLIVALAAGWFSHR